VKTRVFLLVFFMVLLATIPVSAKDKTVGDQIYLFPTVPPTTDIYFTADAPFYVGHGFRVDPSEQRFKDFRFDFYINGVQQDLDRLIKEPVKVEEELQIILRWTYNYPGGLPAGDYTFRGVWLEKCQAAYEDGTILEPCDNPADWVEVLVNDVAVHFE
jgi:hypothetical protein